MRAGGDSAEEQEAAEQAGLDRLASSRSIEGSGDFAMEPDRHVRTVRDAESLEIGTRVGPASCPVNRTIDGLAGFDGLPQRRVLLDGRRAVSRHRPDLEPANGQARTTSANRHQNAIREVLPDGSDLGKPRDQQG